MRKNLYLFPLFIVALAITVPAAAQHPNLSGRWTLDRDKSDFGPQPMPSGYIYEIDHTDPDIHIQLSETIEGDELEGRLSYKTDGSESVNEVMDNTVHAKARWEGDVLVIDSSSNFNGSDIVLNDRWSLSSDGRTLTLKRHFEGPQGKADQTMVLTKEK